MEFDVVISPAPNAVCSVRGKMSLMIFKFSIFSCSFVAVLIIVSVVFDLFPVLALVKFTAIK